MKIKKLVVATMTVAGAFGAFGGELDATKFTHKAFITFRGYDGASTLTNFPALVKIAEGIGGFSYADCAQAKGSDVRFSLGDGKELPSEVVTWNPSGTSEFWVRIPELTGLTRIMMFWGNVGAKLRPQDALPWSKDYKIVYGMNETTSLMKDSGVYGAHGMISANARAVPGLVGGSRGFDGSSQDGYMIGHLERTLIRPQKSVSWEFWFKQDKRSSSMRPMLTYDVNDYNKGMLFLLTSGGNVQVKFGANLFDEITSAEVSAAEWHHVLFTHDNGTRAYRLYVDGAQSNAGTMTKNWFDDSQGITFRVAYSTCKNTNFGSYTKYFDGELDEIRVSAGVRNADYAKAVFMNAASNDVFQVIEAEPETATEIAVAGEPAAEIGEGVRYVADGAAKLFADGVEVASAPAGAKHVVTLTPMKKQYKVTVTAGAGGAVEPVLDGEWIDAGTLVEVKATAADATKAFYAWGGNCPTLEVFTASFRLPVDRPRSLTAQFGTAWYVKTAEDGGNDAADGLSAATAKATLGACYSAMADADDWPAVMLVDEGTYSLRASGADLEVIAEAPIAIRSLKGAEVTKLDQGNANGKYGIRLNHIGSVLDGFQFLNGSGCSWNYAGVYLQHIKGHVQNCIFSGPKLNINNCSGVQSGTTWGATSSVGWFRNCVFRNGTYNPSTGNYFGAPVNVGGCIVDSCVFTNNIGCKTIRMTDAIVRNCLFADNTSKQASYGAGGGLYLNGASLVENCTFVNNKAEYRGGAMYGTAVAVNCAFSGNKTTADSDGADLYGTDVRTLNCLSANFAVEELVNGNKLGVPTFADAENRDFRPTGVSPSIDAGAYTQAAYTPGATDLVGSNRVNKVVDIGCYEYVPTGDEPLAVNVLADVQSGVDALTVAFTATVSGSDDVSYAWDFGDGTTSTEANPQHFYAKAGYYTVTLTVTDNKDATRTATFADGKDMIKIKPTTCYVRKSGESTPVEPYATPETAANDVYTAFLVGSSKIDVGEGNIPMGSAFTIERALEIRGKGREVTRLDENGGCRLTVANAGVVIADLMLCNEKSAAWNVGMLHLSADAIVTNCVFSDFYTANGHIVYLSSGRLVDCVVRNASNYTAQPLGIGIQGGGVQVIGCVVSNLNQKITERDPRYGDVNGIGIMVYDTYSPTPIIRNCLIANNRGTAFSEAYTNGVGAGICLRGKAIVENCTIVSNVVNYGKGAGLHAASGSGITNVIVWGNSIIHRDEIAGAVDNVTGARSVLSHCCAPELTDVAGCVTADPKLNFGKKAKLPYYAILGNSPCKNAGTKAVWMDAATDLVGNPRIYGGAPDMGCYESQSGGMLLIVR